MRVLIIGAGYVGLRLGAELVRRGHEVFGVRRTEGGEAELKAAGVKPLFAEVTDPASLQRLPQEWDWVVNTVSSSRGGLEDYQNVYLKGTRNLLSWLAKTKLQKYVYTSSTSVYGQTDGSVVDETSSTEPNSATSKVLIDTEQLLLEAAKNQAFPASILRVAGIYGPGRGHLFLQYLRGEAKIFGKGDKYLNMIHLEDVAGAIISALERAEPGEIYNVADDEPVKQIEFFTWLSQILKKPMPPILPESERPEKKRGLTNKRILNTRLKRELGYALKYPNFRAGYAGEIKRLGLA